MKVKTNKGKEIELITSWDDGSKHDMRLAELLLKYNLPAIFYIPTNTCELEKEQIFYLSKNFDIGGHTVNHHILRDIHPDDVFCELADSKEELEDLIERRVTSFCYPRGRYNAHVIQMVKDAGYEDARTTKVLNMVMPKNQFEIETTAHVYNRAEYNGIPWQKKVHDLFRQVIDPETPYNYFHLWGHSWEIEKFGYWKDLEFLFHYMNKRLV